MARVPRRPVIIFVCVVTAVYCYRKFCIQSDSLARLTNKETANRGVLSSFRPPTTTTTGEKKVSFELSNILNVPRLSHPILRRVLNDTQYKEVRKLVAEIDKIFTENNITYIMMYGTLLGSYFVHDILPWDDDLDFSVEESDIPRMMALFNGSKYGHMETYNHPGRPTKVKVYFKDSPHAGRYHWRWPFADVSTYKEVNGSVCCIHSSGETLTKESFYPFHRRLFAGFWLQAPREPRQFLKQNYHTMKCQSQGWSHSRETGKKSVKVSCDALKEYYPMVYRSPEGSGVRETLKLGEKVLYSVYVNETYRGQSGPFELDGTE